jgi:hypothetical protein
VIRGWHVLALVGLILTAVAVRSTEFYASRYEMLPVIDWLESRPPLAQSRDMPSALDLARSLPRFMPLLVIREDAHTVAPIFGPPASVQRTVGGVRDAARILLATPDAGADSKPAITARLDVIVFNRQQRAAAWSELMANAMDVRDVESGMPQVRIAGPDEPDPVWVPSPGPERGGSATVGGYRGTVGFMLQISFLHDDRASVAQLVDISARAEVIARRAASDWTGWIEQQLPSA